ncbi:hypothetical protein PYW08_013044 [Mythimna loreyi]|uniref:Uncharacterized protein n=1 Tax=Mythimna loreyi TaxID=667449 RepID=A0ACC2Q1B1_9NEOP|nr:hypothetical protein PYW08_013044 [Mythimna loreyi]
MNLRRTRINTESDIAELPIDSERSSESVTPPELPKTSDGALVELQSVSTKFDTPEKLLNTGRTETDSPKQPQLSDVTHLPLAPLTPPPHCVAVSQEERPYLVEPEREIKSNKKITGRRIVDIQLGRQENLLIEDCGLFVDKEFPFIGATPDGVVGENNIVEVKCPVAAFKHGIDNAIKQNKVQILKYNKKNNQVTLNKNSNWYYQAQGQLRVTGKQRCIFGIWGGEDEKMEVVYIQKDDVFWKNNMEPKLVNFYYTHILPELVDSRRNRGMPLRGSEKGLETIVDPS